jgi:hypothetical protein
MVLYREMIAQPMGRSAGGQEIQDLLLVAFWL